MNTRPSTAACALETLMGAASSALESISTLPTCPASEDAQPCRKVQLPGTT